MEHSRIPEHSRIEEFYEELHLDSRVEGLWIIAIVSLWFEIWTTAINEFGIQEKENNGLWRLWVCDSRLKELPAEIPIQEKKILKVSDSRFRRITIIAIGFTNRGILGYRDCGFVIRDSNNFYQEPKISGIFFFFFWNCDWTLLPSTNAGGDSSAPTPPNEGFSYSLVITH